MDELYFWGSAVIVGLLLLKLIPASKLSTVNKKMRSKIPGSVLVLLYFLISAFTFVGIYLICLITSANVIITRVLTGSILGAFIGLIPLVDKKHSV